MSQRIPVIAIIGRTNVGKSTLFNQIAGRRLAIVSDTHGVTRDRSYTVVNRFEFPFILIDTGGIVGAENDPLQVDVRQQTMMAVQEADLVIGVFDGIHGVHPYDEAVVRMLREAGKPVLWVVNKCESDKSKLVATELYSLGIEDLNFVSAAHNQGVRQLVSKFWELLGDVTQLSTDENADQPIRVAILGRPNVGKSTLVNTILGAKRLVTSDLAGTTRDTIDVEVTRDDQKFLLIDTAGLRRKSKIPEASLERCSALRTLRAVARADVCVLLIDATQGPPVEQDTKIATLIHERGRGLIIAVNKWDAIEKDHRTVKEYERVIYQHFKFAPYAPILFISALGGKRCTWVLKRAQEVYQADQTRIKTSELNRVLEHAFRSRPAPVYHGQPIKLFFSTQVSIAPPTIVLFMNQTRKLGSGYERYLKNCLRKEFPFVGYDIKLLFRKRQDNRAEAANE